MKRAYQKFIFTILFTFPLDIDEFEDTIVNWSKCTVGLQGINCQTGVPKLFDYHMLKSELEHLVKFQCTLPYIEELQSYFLSPNHRPNIPSGLFWVKHQTPQFKGYSWYINYPSGRVIEYGNLSFSAYLQPICKRSSGMGKIKPYY